MVGNTPFVCSVLYNREQMRALVSWRVGCEGVAPVHVGRRVGYVSAQTTIWAEERRLLEGAMFFMELKSIPAPYAWVIAVGFSKEQRFWFDEMHYCSPVSRRWMSLYNWLTNIIMCQKLNTLAILTPQWHDTRKNRQRFTSTKMAQDSKGTISLKVYQTEDMGRTFKWRVSKRNSAQELIRDDAPKKDYINGEKD